MLKFHRCITHTGNPGSGKGDLKIKISYKWMMQEEKKEGEKKEEEKRGKKEKGENEKKEEKEKKSGKFWIIDLCESTPGANYKVLK